MLNLDKITLCDISLNTIWIDQYFNTAQKVKELASEMKTVGQIKPITICCLGKNDEERKNGFSYELICGFRRYEAAKLLGWETIQAKILWMKNT